MHEDQHQPHPVLQQQWPRQHQGPRQLQRVLEVLVPGLSDHQHLSQHSAALVIHELDGLYVQADAPFQVVHDLLLHSRHRGALQNGHCPTCSLSATFKIEETCQPVPPRVIQDAFNGRQLDGAIGIVACLQHALRHDDAVELPRVLRAAQAPHRHRLPVPEHLGEGRAGVVAQSAEGAEVVAGSALHEGHRRQRAHARSSILQARKEEGLTVGVLGGEVRLPDPGQNLLKDVVSLACD
mmetsp:Transcript_90025/g.263167  ORF Transcript_90025/g.263167 Transcript_90025/m.263167 type:complete len:238 (-) Transcript_90025:685-1398(-)